MAKKIKPGAEEDEGIGAEIHDSDETELSDHDIKMKQLRCRQLELLCLQLEIDNEVGAQERKQRLAIDASEHQQRWVIGIVAASVAGIVPLAALGTLFYVMWRHRAYFFLMDAVPQAVLISASFLSLVVIYSFLIKGMFPGVIQKNDTNSSHPVADEILKAVRSAIAGKE